MTTVTEQQTDKLIAFHGDPAIKKKYLARVRAHVKADEIIHGKYWEDGKGCAVGCTIHSDKHDAYETELGIPAQLAHLEDAIFEGLSNGEAQLFPEKFLKAIKPGADLSLVIPKFVVWSGLDEKEGIINLAEDDEERACVQLVAGLYQRIIDGGTVSQQEWEDAYSRARARAWAGARAWAREQKRWIRLSEKLLELLADAHVPE
jgi:hypothetical protein